MGRDEPTRMSFTFSEVFIHWTPFPNAVNSSSVSILISVFRRSCSFVASPRLLPMEESAGKLEEREKIGKRAWRSMLGPMARFGVRVLDLGQHIRGWCWEAIRLCGSSRLFGLLK